jgi:molybdopterin-containing oxidoreductase family iron-sulfur binding subunit
MRRTMKRREFVKKGGMIVAGAACAGYLSLLAASTSGKSCDGGKCKWGMVIDLNKCLPDCTACVDACRHENNVAFHNDKRYDIYRIRKVKLKKKHTADETAKPMLLLCNQCDNAPCVQACPVKATYRRHDGIVIVDHHRCVGCRYCMLACPYNARQFNFKENHEWENKDQPKRSHGVTESCNFCAHRLDSGEKPACVTACEKIQVNALAVGNLNDPKSNVSQLISHNKVKSIREDLGTKPKVYYIGL